MTFWQTIKNNFQNGNIAKWTMGIGAATTGAAMTGMIIHDMKNNNHCGSIFGGFNSSFMGGYTPYSGFDYYGMGYGQTSPYLTQAGLQDAYNYGYMLAQQNSSIAAQQPTNTVQALPKTNDKYAGDIEKDYDKTQGEAFDKATDELTDSNGNPAKGKSFKIADASSEEKYLESISNLGKSYLAQIDQTNGNSDGIVTKDEFIKHEMSKLPEDATEAQKAQAKTLAEIAYSKIDKNQDNKADWKEFGATLSTFDKDDKNVRDGRISSEDYEKWSTAMIDSSSTTFDEAYRARYNKLFGE